jgi:hypothetical protein
MGFILNELQVGFSGKSKVRFAVLTILGLWVLEILKASGLYAAL